MTAWVLNSPSDRNGSISAFDARTFQFKGSTAAGRKPPGLALSPAASVLLAANAGDGKITAVKNIGVYAGASIPAGAAPVGVTTNR